MRFLITYFKLWLLYLVVVACSPTDVNVQSLKEEMKLVSENKANPDKIKHKDAKLLEESASPNSYLSITKDVAPECSKESFQIKTASDLAQISHCEIIDGDLKFVNYQDHLIDLGSIGSVRGDVIVHNASNLQSIRGDSLQSISGKMDFKELTSLGSISLPSLSSVNEIIWKVLPVLTSVSLESGIKNVESLVITDTALEGFSGFDIEKLKVLIINNNRYLETISANVKKVTQELSIAANALNVNVSFPALTWANNITFRDVQELDIKALEAVDASIGFIDNRFKHLKVPQLKAIGGTLIVAENTMLESIEFPKLEEVEGGLVIVQNALISKVNFLPKLQSIGGAIKFNGNFKDLSMPKLRLVKGSASVKTTSQQFDCSHWIRSDASNVVRGGKIECSANAKSSETIHVDDNGMITGSLGSERKELSNGVARLGMILSEVQVIVMILAMMSAFT